MSYTIPEDFHSTLVKTFDDAVKSGDLIYTPSTTEMDTIDDIQYAYSLVPGLNDKPTGESEPEPENKETKPFDPFDPPSAPLIVLPTYAEDYAVVLNKFSVVPQHFLLITKKPYPQAAPLTPPDLAACYHLLRAANKQAGARHVGFFNCGPASGASVDHRHVQFFKLPENFVPWPDHISSKHRSNYKNGDPPLSLEKSPFFTNYLVPLESIKTTDAESEEELEDHLSLRYSTLLSRVLTAIRNTKGDPADPETLEKYNNFGKADPAKNAAEVSYNLVFTEDWMLAVPRTAPDYVDSEADVTIGVNAVGVIGMLLAKSEQELEFIKNKGPLSIVTGVSLPATYREEDIDYDY